MTSTADEYLAITGLRPEEAAGLRHVSRARSTGTIVGVYQSAEAGIEDDPSIPWMTVCEVHHTCCGHETYRMARSHAVAPEGWCEDCYPVAEQRAAGAA